jgi:two-component system, sensor histidine kinase and response regulator
MDPGRTIRTILQVGVVDGFTFEETRKIKALNFGVLLAFPLQVFFCSLNSWTGHYLLALINGLMATANVLTMVLQYYRRYQLARCIYVIGILIIFTYVPVYFHNSTEYILILNIAAILLLFDNKAVYCFFILLDAACFVFVKVSIGFITPIAELSAYRNILSLATFFFFFTIVLLYYRRQQTIYQKKLEKINEFLNEKSRGLEELNKTKEKIFSILSHDLRQPLISVKSLLHLMDKNALSQETFFQMSRKVNSSLDHIILSLDNTLNWSISQLNGIQSRPETLTLYEIAGNVYDLLQENIQSKNLIYIDNIQVTAKVYADKEQVTIILRNLLSNAIKFTRPGGMIHLSVLEKTYYWEVNIEDTGIGMDEEMIGKLFNSAHLFTRRGTENEKGTGLGLTLIKELIQKNEGDISVKSSPGKGTIFSVLLKKAV